MLPLKEYQQRALDTLQAYFRLSQKLGNADDAFYRLTRETIGRGVPYQPVEDLPGLPYVCLRIPTGGGKTLVASHAIGITAHDLLHTDHALVLWLAPSNVIRDQTLRALADPNHPYRQAVESRVGAVTVMSVSEALFIQPATLNSSTVIVIGTIQAFRVDNTEGRKVYESSGALMSHFTDLPSDLRGGLEMTNGEPKKSLANVLYMRRPIVIVDEAHNARTPLSFETLARFHPACILEFTATPATQDHASNVLHSASAAELKSEAMIKMPIRLKVRPQWKELLSDAIIQRNRLEAAARLEQRQSGEYLRPIMLLQAQARSQNKETLTVDIVRKTLIDDFKILENQIARATGEIDEIGDIDLSHPDCPIRYIITVQALREGWDCPFAYVLCSVAESKSSTAVEQILGRILRMPKAARKKTESLNLAYAFATSENFGVIANQLRDSLVQNGFERYEAQLMIQMPPEQPDLPLFGSGNSLTLPAPVSISVSTLPALDDLPPETSAKLRYDANTQSLVVLEQLEPDEADLLVAMLPAAVVEAGVRTAIERATRPQVIRASSSPAERGETLAIPQLVVRHGQQLDLFEETAFLDHPWDLSQCDTLLSESEYSGQRLGGTEIEYDVTDKGKLKEEFINELQQMMTLFAADQGWTSEELVYWLDRAIPHPDITFRESNAFITRLVMRLIESEGGRGFILDQLVADKYHLRDAVAEKMQAHRQEARKQAYNLFLLPDSQTPLEVHPEICFTYPQDAYPYNTLYRGAYPFKKHYYTQIGDLEDHGEEFNCAVYLDSLPEVKVWVRNLERRPNHSFWLQTSTDRFYPDFVCLLNDGRYLVVEYKGEDRWSNDDSREKRIIGEVWGKRGGDSKCLFCMPKGNNLETIVSTIKRGN
jgi:type III restriction enzyme